MKDTRKKILVVDDNISLNKIISMALEYEQYEVMSATDGKDALRAVTSCMPDLILLDMDMPLMNGPQFIAAFERCYGHKRPIVTMSASCRDQQTSAECHFNKPFNLDKLYIMLRSTLKNFKPISMEDQLSS